MSARLDRVSDLSCALADTPRAAEAARLYERARVAAHSFPAPVKNCARLLSSATQNGAARRGMGRRTSGRPELNRLRSSRRMSNAGYHANDKPPWWARLGSGKNARFLHLPAVRGDEYLDVEIDLPIGTEVHLGAGHGHYKTVRETVAVE